MQVTKKCEYCGREFGVSYKFRLRRFCSKSCRMSWQNGIMWKNTSIRQKFLDNHGGGFAIGWYHKEDIRRYNNIIRIYRDAKSGRFMRCGPVVRWENARS